MSADTTTIVALGATVLAVTAAARSTWSPCGVSMLSTVTPLAERARGHRYRTTAAWFVAGSAIGGACLGAVMALLALGVHAAGWTTATVALLGAVACVVAAASDHRLGGFHLPVHYRQVNERWLDQFRPWVYGAGFGWQIGTGLTTYIKTAAVYLTIALAALTGDPGLAFAIGVLFGVVRGLAVLLGRGITTSERLARFHQRFAELDAPARAATIAAELAVGALVAWLVSPYLVLAVVLLAVAMLARGITTLAASPPNPRARS
jgi:hypothetical protein